MKITALDIHQKEFSHGMRGYRENEVDDFLDGVAAEVDRLTKEVVALTQRATEAEERARLFEGERDSINSALLVAQRSADELIAKTEVHCRRLIAEAEAKSQELIHEAMNTKRDLMAEVRRLKEDEISFRDAYRDMLETSLLSIEEVPLSAALETELTGDSGIELDFKIGDYPISDEGVETVDDLPSADDSSEPSTSSSAVPLVAPVAVPEVVEQASESAPASAPSSSVISAPAASAGSSIVDAAPLSAPEPVVDASGQPMHSFIIGETAGQAPIDTTLSEPSEFKGSAFAGWGDREDDIDIEEID